MIHIRLFDMAVNLGQRQAVILLQRAINQRYREDALEIDGILGKKPAMRHGQWSQNIDYFIREQLIEFYNALCEKRPELRVFHEGGLDVRRWSYFMIKLGMGLANDNELPFIYQILKIFCCLGLLFGWC